MLYRLRQRLDLVEDKYKKSTETILGTEHLTMVKKAPSHDVTITNQRNIILEGNVLEVAFNEQFKSKLHAAGDSVTFTNPENITTDEGTLLIPAGSVFSGSVLEIKDPQWFNKNARVYVQLNKITTPDGNLFLALIK